jgi:hypothetical protein
LKGKYSVEKASRERGRMPEEGIAELVIKKEEHHGTPHDKIYHSVCKDRFQDCKEGAASLLTQEFTSQVHAATATCLLALHHFLDMDTEVLYSFLWSGLRLWKYLALIVPHYFTACLLAQSS